MMMMTEKGCIAKDLRCLLGSSLLALPQEKRKVNK
jgi:hypothetical protein